MSGNETIEGIELGAELGHGGAAQVFRGTDLDFQREVAVKILRDPGTEKDRQQWDREKMALGRVGSHPGIATVHRAGRTAQTDRPYVVMELINGDTADRWLAAQPQVQVGDIVRLADEVAEAIAFAHSQGVIHGDLKPSNILVRNTGEPVVVDFGISRVLGTTATDLSAAGFTFGYVAPELLSGERLSERCDVYGLAATVYALLAGHAPHNIEPGMHLAAAFSQVIQGEVEPLPDTLPLHVRRAVHAGLARDPNQRPATVTDFSAALRGEGAIDPERTVGPDTWQRQSPIDQPPSSPPLSNPLPSQPPPSTPPPPTPTAADSGPLTPGLIGDAPADPNQVNPAPAGFAAEATAHGGPPASPPSAPTPSPAVRPDRPSTPPHVPVPAATPPSTAHNTWGVAQDSPPTQLQPQPTAKTGRPWALLAAAALALVFLLGGGIWALLSQRDSNGQTQAADSSDDAAGTDADDQTDTADSDQGGSEDDSDTADRAVETFALDALPVELAIPAHSDTENEAPRLIEMEIDGTAGQLLWVAIDQVACRRWGNEPAVVRVFEPSGDRIISTINPCRGRRGLNQPLPIDGRYRVEVDIPDNAELSLDAFDLARATDAEVPFLRSVEPFKVGDGLYAFSFEGAAGQSLLARPPVQDCARWASSAAMRVIDPNGEEVASALSPCIDSAQMLNRVLPRDGTYHAVFEVRSPLVEDSFELTLFDALAVEEVPMPFYGSMEPHRVDNDRLYAIRIEADAGDTLLIRPETAACDRWDDSPKVFVYDTNAQRVARTILVCLPMNQLVSQSLDLAGTHVLLVDAPDGQPFELAVIGDAFAATREMTLPFRGDLARFEVSSDAATFHFEGSAGARFRLTPDLDACARWGRDQPEIVIVDQVGDRVDTIRQPCDTEDNSSELLPADGRYHVVVSSPDNPSFDAQVDVE